MKRGTSKTSKGGVRNKAKDVVDIDHLVDLWLELSKKGCEIFSSFGEYKSVWAECAPRVDLVDLVDVARAIAKVSPGMQVKYGDLKEAAMACTHKDQSCKPSRGDTVQEASKKIADSFVIVQKHFRVLALNKGWEVKLSLLMRRLSQTKQDKLQDFVDFLRKLNEDELANDSAPAGSSTSRDVASGGAPSTELKTDTMPLSQVSQDEYGLPKVPCSDGSSDLDVGKPLPISKQEIRTLKAAQEPEIEVDSVCKRPAASCVKRPAAKGGKNVGAPKVKASSFKRPAANEDAQATEGSKDKGSGNQGHEVQLYTTFGTDQSYICVKEDNKKGCGIKHAEVIRKIYHQSPKSKAEALELRQQYLDAQDEG
ncbi:unnamed protein product [Durusdinium trenchii]|uniref:Uncharacterized protein n=1 Tax=Durusdinium trenchii TaxID=1381693 RepID=A0ABP0QA73_9DINO